MESVMAMKQILPFWGRVSVVESPVDEQERGSGIVVPFRFEGSDGVKRGVVLTVDLVWDEATPGAAMAEVLAAGVVVYYRGGTKIGDVVILEMSDVLAYEDS